MAHQVGPDEERWQKLRNHEGNHLPLSPRCGTFEICKTADQPNTEKVKAESEKKGLAKVFVVV